MLVDAHQGVDRRGDVNVLEIVQSSFFHEIVRMEFCNSDYDDDDVVVVGGVSHRSRC
jgi:hypothetical protein